MVSFAYTLTDPMGLHMRPAGVMAKRLAETPCSVVIRCGTRSADAKSILNVMALAAKCGETVTIEVSGEDEEATLQELADMMDPPMKKSGLNNRFRKIEELAGKL